MSELLFEYKGKELIRPLTTLLKIHDENITAIDAKISRYGAADIEAAKEAARLSGPRQTAGELEVRRLNSERVELLARRRETELWLFECRRTPRAKWQLTMRDLAALYPIATPRIAP